MSLSAYRSANFDKLNWAIFLLIYTQYIFTGLKSNITKLNHFNPKIVSFFLRLFDEYLRIIALFLL